MFTHIIWDFNGTLLDDLDASRLAVNPMLAERGLPILHDAAEYREKFGFPIKEYYRRLGFDFSKDPYEVLAPIWVANYNKTVLSSPLRENTVEVLSFIRGKGIPQILLSATEKEMLLGQISMLGLGTYFDEVLGMDTIHAYSKERLAVEWKRKNPDAVPLFIGDTVHDAEVAKAVGAEVKLVLGGHQSEDKLRETGFDVYRDLSELMKSIMREEFHD